MNENTSTDEVKKAVLHSLHLVAPEADLDSLDPDAPLQREIELDSLDFLRFMQQLHKALNIDVPEKDYEQLATLNQCVVYLTSHSH